MKIFDNIKNLWDEKLQFSSIEDMPYAVVSINQIIEEISVVKNIEYEKINDLYILLNDLKTFSEKDSTTINFDKTTPNIIAKYNIEVDKDKIKDFNSMDIYEKFYMIKVIIQLLIYYFAKKEELSEY